MIVWMVCIKILFRTHFESRSQLIYLAADAGIGSVPIIGQIADIFFTANLFNLGMLEKHIKRTRPHIRIPHKNSKPLYPEWFNKIAGPNPQRKFK
jgi:hypothetical protein